MFGLNTHMVKITGVELRTEHEEGKAPVGAVDIGVNTDVENITLNDFHPRLRASFYESENPGQSDMLDTTTPMPVLIFPKFPRFTWAGDLEGYTFIAHTGVNERSEIKIADVKINSVKFKMKDKGIVDMTFVIRAHDNPGDIDKLRKLLGLEVQISLVPPDKAKQHAIESAKQAQRQKLEQHFTPENGDPHTGSLIPAEDDQDREDENDDTSAAGGDGSTPQGQYQVE